MNDPLGAYGAARDDAVEALAELAPLVDDSLDAVVARLRDGRFVLAVVGEFSSGKSFLLNALLGKVEFEERAGSRRIVGLLKTDVNPSTATITELAYAHDEIATAVYANGREERVPIGRLARFVAVGEEAALHDATSDEDGAPILVRVGVDSAFLRSGFVVADTPGLASINPAHRRATLGYLPGADAVLYLIDTQQPFTEGDASFLGIVRRYIESIFIVQTKIDLWRMTDGGREAWQGASARIVEQAALHAPGTPVFPLSAREYAESLLTGDEALRAQSRFPPFLAALDASLVATTGRARLRRAATTARAAVERTTERLSLLASAMELDPAALTARRAAIAPVLDALDRATLREAGNLRSVGDDLLARTRQAGDELRADLRRSLSRAFDTADVARLRDRARLHIIVDNAVAATAGRFAATLADDALRRLRTCARDALAAVVDEARHADRDGNLAATLDTLAAEPLALAEHVAPAFDGDAQSGAWSGDPENAVRSALVLGALGGPAVGFVTAIADRFAAQPPGAYMKRELLADLSATLWAQLDADIAAFVDANGARFARVAEALAARLETVAPRARAGAAGAIDAALEAIAAGADRAGLAAEARTRAERAATVVARLETVAESFARRGDAARRELADPVVPLDPESGRSRADTAPAARFDPSTYEHGLRPERWRVVVLGGLKRGKSSFINAVAGTTVLDDEGQQGEMRFPVHVRYGPEHKAYALADDAGWEPIPTGAVLDAAARTPVLIEIPWRMPRQLVLVHAPPFDAGSPMAEEIVRAAAASASEIVALFSRQLSERELDLFARIAERGVPMAFAHTMADHEEPGERRQVVTLAERYLRERGIAAQRVYTISTHEAREAEAAGRAPAGWNEVRALIATLEAHAEEHMARLARAERDAAERERLVAAANAAETPARSSFLGRLFRRS